MNADFWTLEYSGTTQTFEEWNIDQDSARRNLRSGQLDELQLTQKVAFDSLPAFEIGSTVQVYRGGVRWFYGRVIGIEHVGDPDDEFIRYQIAGPWWYLENLVFQQDWKVASNRSDPNSSLVNQARSRIILFQALNGSRIKTGDQVAAIIDYAIAAGAPITKGTIFTGIEVPFAEVVDYTCAELIQNILRWTPDVTISFEYSTSTPTMHVRRRSEGTAVSVAIGSSPVEAFRATPRPDLVPPGVIITFEQQESIDLKSWVKTTVQTAGTDTFGTIKFSVELSGSSKAYQRQYLGTQSIASGSLAWWQAKLPWLNNVVGPDGSGSPVISGGAVSPGFTYEVIEGAVPPWQYANAGKCTVSAAVSYAEIDGNNKTVKANVPIKTTVLGSAISGGNYVRLVSETAGESVPAGCAQGIFDSLSALHYEGQLILLEDEVSSTVRPGMLLNVTGGRSAWTSMDALVQTVEEDLGSGRTVISFGPPSQLSPQEFIELLRIQRARRPSWKVQERQDGVARGAADVEGPVGAANENASSGGGGTQEMVLSASVGGQLRTITLQPSLMSHAGLTGADDIKPRLWEACIDGVRMQAFFLSGAPFAVTEE